MECGVPEKTRNQTKWAVKVWTEWATSRNKKLLSDEAPFSCEIENLSAQLINFWLCRFVMEIRRRDGVAWGLARGVYLVALTTQPSLEDYNVFYSVHACAARYNN